MTQLDTGRRHHRGAHCVACVSAVFILQLAPIGSDISNADIQSARAGNITATGARLHAATRLRRERGDEHGTDGEGGSLRGGGNILTDGVASLIDGEPGGRPVTGAIAGVPIGQLDRYTAGVSVRACVNVLM